MQPEKESKPKQRKAVEKESASKGTNKALSMEPDAYNAVIQQLSPLDVRVVALTYMVTAPVHSGPLSVRAEMDVPELDSAEDAPDGNHYVDISHRAHFKIVASDDSIAADGRVTFRVRLRLGFKPPSEFWKIFLLRNVKLYTHPILRDLTSSLATRSSLVVQPLSSVSVLQVLKPSFAESGKQATKPAGDQG